MRAVTVTLVLIALVAAPAFARGEWYDHYENALEAIARGDHGAAVDSLGSALGLKERSGYLRTYGNNYIRYVPHFQLGVAFHGAGDCEAALASFEDSASSGETSDVPEMAHRLRTLKAECESLLAPPPPVVPETVIEQPEPVETRAPIDRAMLERGLAAYLEADFEASANVFAALAGTTPESARLRLLSGMALHAAWVAGGESEQALIERARVDLIAAAQLDPGLVPDPALCPPRVSALFRSLR